MYQTYQENEVVSQIMSSLFILLKYSNWAVIQRSFSQSVVPRPTSQHLLGLVRDAPRSVDFHVLGAGPDEKYVTTRPGNSESQECKRTIHLEVT